MKRILRLGLLFFFLFPLQLWPQVVINEFLASNQSVVSDEDGDFEDWIELFNAGSGTVNLQGYGLSDNEDEPFRWTLPAVDLPSGAFLLIWASGKDRTQQELHANFSISASGEKLLLTHPDGTLLGSQDPLQLPPDVSHGRQPDGSEAWVFFSQPTPGASNTTQGYSQVLPPPEFSTPSGFFTNPFSLAISSTLPGANIYYTLDGSKPGTDDLLYTGSVQITSRQGEPNDISMIPTNNLEVGPPWYEGWQQPLGEVFKVNVVRAAAFAQDAIPSPVVTATYLVDPLGVQRYSLPVFSLNTQRENLFDPAIGIYVEGNNTNYFQTGPEWEREAHIEFFTPDGNTGFAQNVGVRIHGGRSRNRARKSLRIYSRSQYGTSRIMYRLFPDKAINNYNRFLLRNSGNDWNWTIFRDAFMQHLAKDMNVEIQYFRPSILFVNGEYWGIHNIRDRYDQFYLQTHYGIQENEMTILENNATFFGGNSGGQQHYRDMITYSSENSLADPQHYNEMLTRLDPWSFIDSQIANIFVMNTDWPGNNNLYWRYINEGYDPEAHPKRDGRWRWFLLDMDFGFGLADFYVPVDKQGASHNTLAFAARPDGPGWPNPPWSTLLFRNMLESPAFSNDFINRFADLLNTNYREDHVVGVIDSIAKILRPEMQEHSNRWRQPPSMEQWEQNVELMREFGLERPTFMRQHIQSFFNLEGTATLGISVNDTSMGKVQVNTVVVPADPLWSGIYFLGVPMSVIAHPRPGYRLAFWEGISDAPGDTLQLTLTGDISVGAIFESSGDFAGDEMNPPAYLLRHGPYLFNYWDPNEPRGSFPPHMAFHQSDVSDPGLEAAMTHPYHLPFLEEYHQDDLGNLGYPYRLTGRTRINGLWDQGISFVNTGRERDLGAAVLALDTRGVTGLQVSWTGGTLIPGSRTYAIRLQYRIGLTDSFVDVTDAQGIPVEYFRNELPGHFTEFDAIELPQELEGQSYVLLRWKVYFTGEQLSQTSGVRDMLRLDNILVSYREATSFSPEPASSPDANLRNHPNPFVESTRISFVLHQPSRVTLSLLDQRGMHILELLNSHLNAGSHELDFHAGELSAGAYFYRLQTDQFSVTRKMVIIK